MNNTTFLQCTLLKNEKFKGRMTTDILIIGYMRPVASKFNPKSIKGVVFGTREVFLGCINGNWAAFLQFSKPILFTLFVFSQSAMANWRYCKVLRIGPLYCWSLTQLKRVKKYQIFSLKCIFFQCMLLNITHIVTHARGSARKTMKLWLSHYNTHLLL